MEISKKMDNDIIMKIAKKKLVSVMFQYRSTAAVSAALPLFQSLRAVASRIAKRVAERQQSAFIF